MSELSSHVSTPSMVTAMANAPLSAPPEIPKLPPREWVKAWRVGKWNTLKVRCVGKYPRITTWLNGQKICEFDGATFKQSQYDREKVHGILGDKGSIAVQVHGGGGWPKGAKVRWRNILVREL